MARAQPVILWTQSSIAEASRPAASPLVAHDFRQCEPAWWPPIAMMRRARRAAIENIIDTWRPLSAKIVAAHPINRSGWPRPPSAVSGGWKRIRTMAISGKRSRNGGVDGVVGIEDGVVSGVIHLQSSGVGASDWRPRHEKHYQERSLRLRRPFICSTTGSIHSKLACAIECVNSFQLALGSSSSRSCKSSRENPVPAFQAA